MNELLAQMRSIEGLLDTAARCAFAGDTVQGLTDAETAELLTVSSRIQRRLEGVQIEAVDVVVTRSDRFRDERMTTAYGCASPVDLVRMLLATDARSAGRLIKASKLVHREQSFSAGEYLPARFPALRDAITDGELGVAGFLAATDPVTQATQRLSEAELRRVDAELANLVRGIDADEADANDSTADDATAASAGQRPCPLPEELALYAKVMLAYLDPDGPTPSDEEDLMRGRFLHIGPLKNGVHSLRGALLPDVAAQLALLQDSLLNPKVSGRDSDADATAAPALGNVRFEDSEPADADASPCLDTRTRAQKEHDAFASILATAAALGHFPHLGGAAPTLTVAADAADLAAGTGWATIPRTGERVPLSVAQHTACTGGIQRVLFDDRGRIVSIGTTARIFNALQRRAITLRDGGCIIPGCTIPATWCEIHHVRESADGGPTHTDNGVLLCWFHHRALPLSGWTIRMNHGAPEVRGPAWWDPHQRWHRPQSPHRRRRPAPV